MCVQVSGRSTGASALALQDPRASGVDPQAAGVDHKSWMMWQQYQQFLNFQNNQNQNRRQNNINITYTKSQRKALPPGEPEKSPPSAAGGTPRSTLELDSQEVLEEPAGEETPPTLPSRSSPPLNQVDPKRTPQEGQSGDRGLAGTSSVVAVYDPAKASKRVLEALAERTVRRKAEKDEEQKKEEERKKKEEEEQKMKEDQKKKKKVPPSKTEPKAKQETKKTEAGESGAKAKAKAKAKAEAKSKAKAKAKAKAKSSKGNADEKEDEPAEETTEVKQEDPETTGDESRRQYTKKWYNARHKMGIVKLPANKQLCQFGNASVEKEKLVEIANEAIDKLISGSLQETGLKLWCEEQLAKCVA